MSLHFRTCRGDLQRPGYLRYLKVHVVKPPKSTIVQLLQSDKPIYCLFLVPETIVWSFDRCPDSLLASFGGGTPQGLFKNLRLPTMLQPRTIFRSLTPLQSASCLPFRALQISQFPTTTSPHRTLSIWHRTNFTTSLIRRPSLPASQSQSLAQSRGMKVRSSVKKLCDACKVGRIFRSGLRRC